MNKIFLIDDDDDDQLLFKEAIELIDPFIEYDFALNGKMALDKLKASTLLPDLIFLDLNMPVMNGFEFLERIKLENHLCSIPIGIITTSNIIEDIHRVKQSGIKFFLTKPNDFQVLCAHLQKIIAVDFTKEEFISIP